MLLIWNIQLFQCVHWAYILLVKGDSIWLIRNISFPCLFICLFVFIFFSSLLLNFNFFSSLVIFFSFCHKNRLSFADIKRSIQHHSTASFARAWANQLPGRIPRALWISSWTFTTMFDYWIKIATINIKINITTNTNSSAQQQTIWEKKRNEI